MDLVKVDLDGAFITARLSLSWRELQFGLVNELISPDACIPFAVMALEKTNTPSRALRDLAASFGGDQEDAHRVAALAAEEPPDDEALTRAKWEYLVMSWFFARWDSIDPYEVAESVAADFGPSELRRPLLRYTPGNRGSLREAWRLYLARMELIVTAGPSSTGSDRPGS